EINVIKADKSRYDNLHRENSELKKNLYQIDTLYNASSKFAGTLEKEKLYEVAFEIFERVLSFDMSCFLVKDDFDSDKLKFYINTLKKTTDELDLNFAEKLSKKTREDNLEALKLNKNALEIIRKTKPSYKNEFFDDSIVEYDKLYATLVIKDK